MTLANKYKIEWKKPKGTSITRLPEGTEDGLFMSFFEGFYENDKCDFGMDKGLDLTTSANQDISKIANQHLTAAKLMMDKLGKTYTVTTYYLDGLKNAVKIDPNEEGVFFSESTYVVDINSDLNRYMVCWMGPKLNGEEIAHTSAAMDNLCGGILESRMCRMRVSQC